MLPTSTAPTHDHSAPLRAWHRGNALLISESLATSLFITVIVKPILVVAAAASRVPPGAHASARRELLVKLAHLVFYGASSLIVGTGLALT